MIQNNFTLIIKCINIHKYLIVFLYCVLIDSFYFFETQFFILSLFNKTQKTKKSKYKDKEKMRFNIKLINIQQKRFKNKNTQIKFNIRNKT